MREKREIWRGASAIAVALLVALAGLAGGCGDDDDDEATTQAETEATEPGAGVETTETATGSACPDVPFASSAIVSIRSSVDCAAASTLAKDVLRRDDCVEESPGGPNKCESQGYVCASEIAPSYRVVFKSVCTAGADTVSFGYRVPKGVDPTPENPDAPPESSGSPRPGY